MPSRGDIAPLGIVCRVSQQNGMAAQEACPRGRGTRDGEEFGTQRHGLIAILREQLQPLTVRHQDLRVIKSQYLAGLLEHQRA